MDEYGNIDLYRKKRRNKRLLRRFLLLLAIVAVVLVGILIWKGISGVTQNSKDTSGFPVSLAGDLPVQSEMMGSRVALLTDKELLLYSSDGNKLRSVAHSDFAPAMSVSDDKALLYDRGGTGFSIEDAGATLLTKTTDHKIMMGEIAPNGNVAIVSEDDRYACRLTVYDSAGNEKFKWYSAQNLITSLSFTGGGSGCVAATTGAKAGVTTGVVYGLDFSRQEELFKAEIAGSMPVSIAETGGFIHVACDNQLVVLDQNGSQQQAVPYTRTLKQAITGAGGYTVLLFGEEVKSDSAVVVYDKNGNQVAITESDERLRRVASDGSHVLLLADAEVRCCDMTLKQINTYTNRQSAVELLCKGGVGYDIGSTVIEKFVL